MSSTLAAKAKQPKEQERLFQVGISRDGSMLPHYRRTKITREDASRRYPLPPFMSISDPTVDFIVGRLVERATDSAARSLYPPSVNSLRF